MIFKIPAMYKGKVYYINIDSDENIIKITYANKQTQLANKYVVEETCRKMELYR